MSMLSVHNLTAGYDEADVVSNVSLEVMAGKITCLLGANGEIGRASCRERV